MAAEQIISVIPRRRPHWAERMWLACIADACESIMRMPPAHISATRARQTLREIEYDCAWLLTVGVGVLAHLEHIGYRVNPSELREWVLGQLWRLDAWRQLVKAQQRGF